MLGMSRSRPQSSTVDAMSYLLDFAQAPPDLVARQAPAIAATLQGIVSRRFRIDWPRPTMIAPDVPVLQRRLRQLFARASLNRGASKQQAQSSTAKSSFKITLAFLDDSGDPRPRVETAAPGDLVVYTAYLTLSEIGRDHVRVCPAPGCGRWFVKQGRKEFCSETCQTRAYMRDYRQNRTGPAEDGRRMGGRDGKKTRTRRR